MTSILSCDQTLYFKSFFHQGKKLDGFENNDEINFKSEDSKVFNITDEFEDSISNSSHFNNSNEASPFITSAITLLKCFSVLESSNAFINLEEIKNLKLDVKQLEEISKFSETETQDKFYRNIIKFFFDILHDKTKELESIQNLLRSDEKKRNLDSNYFASLQEKLKSKNTNNIIETNTQSNKLKNNYTNIQERNKMNEKELNLSNKNTISNNITRISNNEHIEPKDYFISTLGANHPINEQLIKQLERETSFFDIELLQETDDIVKTALEISELNSEFVQRIQEQAEEMLVFEKNVEEGVNSAEKAQNILTKTDERQKKAWITRFWMAIVFIVCSLLLLAMDYVHA